VSAIAYRLDRELAEQVFSRLADHHATITGLSFALKTD